MEKSILLKELKNKSFEEKVEYFSDKAINRNIDSYNLEGEDLLCFAIAKQKEEGVFSTIERAIKIEIVHLKSLIKKYYEGKTLNGFMPKELVLCEEQLEYLENYFIDKSKRIKKKGVQFFIGNPDNGGKSVSSYEFHKTVFPNIEINPVHNCELLIKHRIKQFEESKTDLISERELDNVPVTEYDINFLYSMWLQSELKTIQNWLSPLYPNGTKKNTTHSNSEQIEINKYCNYVNREIETISHKLSDTERKTKIGVKLLGLSTDYEKSKNTNKNNAAYLLHIESVLKEFNITPIEGVKILREVRNGYDKHFNEVIIPQIIEYLNSFPPQQTETNTKLNEDETDNNFLHSTIEDWLFPFKEEKLISETHYNTLVSSLKQYFEKGTFPILSSQIRVGKVNIKRFGWALNEIFKASNTNNEKLSKHIEYLLFAKQNISVFSKVEFDETNVLKSKLYIYFTTKTK